MTAQLPKERLAHTIEQLEHFATNLKWTNVAGAQTLLFAADGLRELLAAHEQEPVADVVAWCKEGEERTCDVRLRRFDLSPGPLYTHPAPSIPAAVPEVHNSVIAEQLTHILSVMTVTDHQRAVISCAVDRLNKNVDTICQLSKADCKLPDGLDYQGAKELFNYLMTEEETNATVNGWNACRAAMLNHPSSNQSSSDAAVGEENKQPSSNDGWIPVSERLPDETQPVIVVSDGGVVQRTVYQFCEGVWTDWYEQYDEVATDAFTYWMPLPPAPKVTP